jgi:hypothetical protein
MKIIIGIVVGVAVMCVSPVYSCQRAFTHVRAIKRLTFLLGSHIINLICVFRYCRR